MDSQTQRKTYPIIPEGEHRCVWMNAGLVAFQICDHPADCDSCPLDAAMRRRYSPAGEVVERAAAICTSSIPESLRDDAGYHVNHCWQTPHGSSLRVGIEPELASVLLVPKSVVLPTLGQKLKAGQPCAWVIMEDGTFPISAVADGEVTALNPAVTRDPQEVFLHPFDTGWLYEFSPEGSPAPAMGKSEAAAKYRLDSVRFQELLGRELQPDAGLVGVTMADGGRPLRNISAVLGPKKYCSIVREAFAGSSQ
jgi:glycine cleavage system H protein